MVHIIFDTSSPHLSNFIQTGEGSEERFFEGLPPYQRGHGGYFVGASRQRGAGIGSVFRGLWRVLLPMLKTAGKTAGPEALATGGRILSDLSQGRNLKEVVQSEAIKGVENLVSKVKSPGVPDPQQGSGRKGIKRKAGRRKSVILTPSTLVGRTVQEVPEINSIKKKRQRKDTFGLY